MHVVEMRGRAQNLIARDVDVCAEGADGRVIPASHDAEPSSSVCANAFHHEDEDEGGGGVAYVGGACLRAFGSEWVALPSARWNEEDALVQQFVTVVVCGHDDP